MMMEGSGSGSVPVPDPEHCILFYYSADNTCIVWHKLVRLIKKYKLFSALFKLYRLNDK
jgi:hypothetical protein